MINKDKRSLILSLLLGDGCFYKSPRGYVSLCFCHSIKQNDFLAWKRDLLSHITSRKIEMHPRPNGTISLAVGMTRFRAWRKFVYRNNKKDISKILPFIRHPEMALAIWFCDDGNVQVSGGKTPSTKFRLHTESQDKKTQEFIVEWLRLNFDVEAKIFIRKNKNKQYYCLKFSVQESLRLWAIIREFVLQFKSMQHKFRHIEHRFKIELSQRLPSQINLTG